MTNDLVKRLRLAADRADQVFDHDFASPWREAADRIEELERHVKFRDVFFVENGLWEQFAKGAQEKTK